MSFIFNSGTTRFDLANALRLAEASELVYANKNEVMTFLERKWGFKNLDFFDREDSQALICANDKVVMLIFRGTENIEDWLRNKDVKLIPAVVGRTHSGFSKALDCIWDDVADWLERYQTNKQMIWVGGHSLGGALAVLAAGRLHELGKDIGGIYTFGQPRVGDKDFAAYFDGQFRRRHFYFVNSEDIVVRVPPRILGYSHVGTVRYIDDNKILQYDNSGWKRWVDRSESVAARSALERHAELKKQYPGGIKDHGMSYYIRYIRQNLDKNETGDFKGYLKNI